MQYCFTVDDNIRFLKELTQQQPEDMFSHPYLAMYRRLHEAHGVKVQLNLFYEMPGFTLSQMTDRYRDQWQANAHWLKLSFHSRLENVRPYESSGYDEVFSDCAAVHREILRFAGPDSLGKTTTIHYCRNTVEGLKALRDQGMQGLLGLYGTDEAPRVSYCVPEALAKSIRRGNTETFEGIRMGSIDMVINTVPPAEMLPRLEALLPRQQLRVMIHEQYFYPDYRLYIPTFEEDLSRIFAFLKNQGFESHFYEEMF